ncbi:HAD family hydrolase [Lysinibacillus sp. CD3-6]|uniref:HAD family hydrolase n=1 Tax=Lysinibacillus sp. CD3-6 TaxID=2892541 RepID=UPI00116BB801|nr:HAD family hydrolase [Lysinibacillus sp. CD3-6]UED82638.1 HAD family hydrolase [Lysinibacillus sp. CD3-6]
MMKAIVFDFDGTLANTLPICYYAFQKVFNKYDNKNLTTNEIKEMFGPSETGIIRKNLSNPNKEEAIEYYYAQYSKLHNSLVEVNSEIRGLLTSLREENIKIGIFTGKAKRSLDISLKALDMEGLFDVMITGDDVLKPKPDPEGLLKALSLLAVENFEAIYIGDSDADIVAGLQANVYTIGVQWLSDYQTEEFKEQPNSIIKSVIEFKQSLKVGIL